MKIDTWNPRDSIKRAMQLRLTRKALEAQQREEALRAEYEAESEAVSEREAASTATPTGDYATQEIYEAISEELNDMEQSGNGPYGPSAPLSATYIRRVENGYSAYTRLLYQARIMSDAHLETIETTLDILTAIEGLSPHVDGLRRQMVAKQAWMHVKHDGILGLEGIERVRIGEAKGTKTEEKGMSTEERGMK